MKSSTHLPSNKTFWLIKAKSFLGKKRKNVQALPSYRTKQRLQVTLHHTSSLRSDAQRLQRHPNNVGARRSRICPVTANKLFTAAMNLLESASSTGMPASDSGFQTLGRGPLIDRLFLKNGTHC